MVFILASHLNIAKWTQVLGFKHCRPINALIFCLILIIQVPSCFFNCSYSWHESGIYDLPAMIKHIAQYKQQNLRAYIGFSMGTTCFYVMATERPEVTKYLQSVYNLAPVVYMKHVQSPLKYFAPLATDFKVKRSTGSCRVLCSPLFRYAIWNNLSIFLSKTRRFSLCSEKLNFCHRVKLLNFWQKLCATYFLGKARFAPMWCSSLLDSTRTNLIT